VAHQLQRRGQNRLLHRLRNSGPRPRAHEVCVPTWFHHPHATATYLLHRPSSSPAWCVAEPTLSPHQRRHWAKVITAIDLAVCRGKYTSKQGDSSRQLCTCKAAALEAVEHFYFECTAYDAVRPPLLAAAPRWCELSCEHATDIAGLRNALLWAATDSALLTRAERPEPSGGRPAAAGPRVLCQVKNL
jgi:hypothetical protein